jgi:hypothetical protein
MRLIQYLVEQSNQKLLENHELVLQQVIDGIDDGHVDCAEDRMTFNIGNLINQPKLKGLDVIVRKMAPGESPIRLAQNKDGNFVIVIDTDELPNRSDLDSYLSSKEIYGGFGQAYNSYIGKHFDPTKEYDKNDTEKHLDFNNRDGFEKSFMELLKGIEDTNGKYNQSLTELDKEGENVAHHGRKQTLELARQNLRDEYIGKDAKEFIAKVLKLPQAEFSNSLDKTWRGKLDSRLSNYYDSKFGR